MGRLNRTVVGGVAILALAACSKKPPAALPPAPPAATAQTAESTQAPVGTIRGSQADFRSRMRGQDVIYFDTNRFDIDEADVAALQSQAQWLSEYPQKRATIEGHADNRGTREYNLALGERRANSTKNYLVGLGIAPSRLTTVSYGKERPVASGSDEHSWAQNRRTATITID